MAVNVNQTKEMLLTAFKKEAKLSPSIINVNVNDTLTKNVNVEKLMGLVIHRHLI